MKSLNIEKLAAIAFFTLRIKGISSISSVYSYDVSKYFNFSISSNGSVIGIFDYQRGNYLSGNPNGNGWSVFDYADSQYISFSEKPDDKFSVYDYASSSYIDVSFQNKTVVLYSYQQGKYHNFGF